MEEQLRERIDAIGHQVQRIRANVRQGEFIGKRQEQIWHFDIYQQHPFIVVAPPREAEVVPAATVANRDVDVDFGVHWTEHDNNNDANENKDKIHNEEEGDVRFSSTDIYDVQELIELCLEDLGVNVEHKARDEVKQLKKSALVKIRKCPIVTHLLTFFLHL